MSHSNFKIYSISNQKKEKKHKSNKSPNDKKGHSKRSKK